MSLLSAENRNELLRWFACGAIVVLAHGGIAATIMHWHDNESAAEPSAALVVDLAPFPVSPPENMTELPPGPEQVEAEASPETPVKEVQEQVVEEKVEVEQTQEVQTELPETIDPEVVLASLPPKPEQQVPTPQVNQLPAPETTAPQTPKFELAPIAAAPVQGQPTLETSNAIPSWRSEVVARLERNKRFPGDAQTHRGIAQVAFSIDRQGRVTSRRILASSGSGLLDREALDMVQRSQPFPPPPAALAGAEVLLTVPVRFNMR